MIEIGRSAVAVLGGYVAMAVLVLISERLLVAYAGGPNAIYIYGGLACSFAAALVGGWVAGWIAQTRPVLHGAILAGVIIGLGLALTLSSGLAPGEPSWRRAAIVGLSALGAIGGGWIFARRAPRAA